MVSSGRAWILRFAILLLLGSLLAGCLSPRGGDGDDEPPLPDVPLEWAALALPHDNGHDHDALAAHHNLSTPNFSILGWEPLVTDYHGSTSGDHLCGGVSSQGDRRIAVIHSFGTDVAFVLADVTDPAAPVKLGEFVLKRAHTYDVDITPDGGYVVIATNPRTAMPDGEYTLAELRRGPVEPEPGLLDLLTLPATTTLEMEWRNACSGEVTLIHEEVPFASGVVLVDVRDPMMPAFADYQATPFLGPHSIHTTKTDDGTLWVLASITNLAHQASYFQFFTIETLPVLDARLIAYGVVTAQYVDPDTQTPLTNGHVDGWIHTHPVTGDNIAYLANWNGGLIVVRLDGPAQITTIGTWNDYVFNPADPPPSGMTGQIHSAYPLGELWGGRHYTLIGQEVVARPEGRPTGQMILMDTTDPADPTPVARWTLPHDMGQWGGPDRDGEFLLFSTHYATVVGDTMFVAMYHGGVWAADLAPRHWPEIPSVGVFIPDNENPHAPSTDLPLLERWTPLVLDVVRTPEGHLVLWDGLSGMYVVEFDAAMELPDTEPWHADAWI